MVKSRVQGSQALRSVLSFTLKAWADRKSLVAAIALAMMLATITEVVVPVYAGRLVDALAAGRSAAGVALSAFLAMMALGFAMVVLRHLAWWSVVPLTLSIMRNVAQGAFHRVQRFSTDWHNNSFAGSIVRKITRGMWALDTINDVLLLALLPSMVVLVGTVLLLGHRWLAAGFDPSERSSAGVGGGALDAVLLGLIALATTAALSVVGALLVAALFVVPALTARLFFEQMPSWQLASVALVAAEGTVGLWLSVKTDAPPGATIAVVAGAVFALAACARALAHARKAPALVLAGTIAAALLLGGCGGSGASDGQLRVVATTTQIGDFVRAVGGDAVAVDQVLEPNTDPHEYEPRPSDVANAAEAKLVFASGDGLDDWIDEVVSDSGSDARVVDLGAIVPERLPGESSGAEASPFDPHWWHDPRNAEAAVAEIERQLALADPAHRRRFERNADAYLSTLRGLDRGIARCMRSVPATQRKLVTDHDAFGYFAHRYGIEVVGAVIPSQTTQAQPSAKDLSALAELIEREQVAAIFPETSLSAGVAEAIADQTGASAEYSLYGDTLGPSGSGGATYLRMEAANANAMVRGFTAGRQGCRALR